MTKSQGRQDDDHSLVDDRTRPEKRQKGICQGDLPHMARLHEACTAGACTLSNRTFVGEFHEFMQRRRSPPRPRRLSTRTKRHGT